MRERMTVLLAAAFLLLALPVSAPAGLESDIERGLGSEIARQLEEQAGVVDDPLLAPWVVSIGEKLAAVSGRQDVRYSFKILDSEEINAAAVPGGHIYVTKGLLRFIDSEDELAGVIGHEIGHIAARHTNKQLKAQILTSLVLSSVKSARLSGAVSGARLAGLLALLKFSRDHELEADELGLKYSDSLGYDGRKIIELFRRMDESQRDRPSRFESYFQTHPTFGERVRRLADRPELNETPESLIRRAANLEDRALPAQAAQSYRKALASHPDLRAARDGLARSPGEDAAFRPEPHLSDEVVKEFDSSFAMAIKAAGDRIDSLGKEQTKLEKQIRSLYSNLQFASGMISQYDLVHVREFMSILDAADAVANMVSRLGALRLEARWTVDEYSKLKDELTDDRSEGGFQRESLASLTSLASSLDAAAKAGEAAAEAARTVDFAARQLASSLMMPGPAALGMSGMVDLQIGQARRSVKSGAQRLLEARQGVSRQRTKALCMRIDLLSADATPRQAYAYESLIARYLRTSREEAAAAVQRLGRLGDAALALAARKMGNADGGSTIRMGATCDYDCLNILLAWISQDIAREKTAANGSKHAEAR